MKFSGNRQPSRAEVLVAIEQGARVVFFEYCVSLILLTLRRPSRLYLLRPGKWRVAFSWRYTLLSICLGWWGLPWGFIYTPLVLATNLQGGVDVTDEVLERWADFYPIEPNDS